MIIIPTNLTIGAIELLTDAPNANQSYEAQLEAMYFLKEIMDDSPELIIVAERIATCAIYTVKTISSLIGLIRLNLPKVVDVLCGHVLFDQINNDAMQFLCAQTPIEFVRAASPLLWPMVGPQYVDLYDACQLSSYKSRQDIIPAIASYRDATLSYLDRHIGNEWLTSKRQEQLPLVLYGALVTRNASLMDTLDEKVGVLDWMLLVSYAQSIGQYDAICAALHDMQLVNLMTQVAMYSIMYEDL